MDTIFHIMSAEQWDQARREGVYRGDTLDTEGFIHCSSAAQVVRVANAFYSGRRGLMLLCIDSAGVVAEIRYERGEGEECFPHIYGPLDIGAVSQVLEFEPGEDGTFDLPTEIVGRDSRRSTEAGT
ncbi:MAG TPA: DUF952 domain-containing protein [Anaerolineae bacterium]|nr:DUF952 domain-containing protein [Anaerolineae bacterium]